MKIYFLSSSPCALTIGGAYFGIVDSFEKFAEINLKDNLFAEFSPENGLPVGVFLNEKLRFSPPEHTEIYILKDGIALFIKEFPPSDFSLSIIDQKRSGTILCTLFRQGKYTLAIESIEKGLSLFSLSEAFSLGKIFFENGLIFVEGKNTLAIFSSEGKQLLNEKIISYKIEKSKLSLTMSLTDARARLIKREWALSEEGIYPLSFSILQRTNEEEAIIRDELLPYALFESVRYGFPFEEFLSDELKEKSKYLSSFIGDFTDILLCDNINEIGVVRKKRDRVYEVDYFLIEVKDGKIIDVKG